MVSQTNHTLSTHNTTSLQNQKPPASTIRRYHRFRNPPPQDSLFYSRDGGFTVSNYGYGKDNNGFLGDTNTHTRTTNHLFEPTPFPLFPETASNTSNTSATSTFTGLPTAPRPRTPPPILSSFSSDDDFQDAPAPTPPRCSITSSDDDVFQSSSHDVVVAQIESRYMKHTSHICI